MSIGYLCRESIDEKREEMIVKVTSHSLVRRLMALVLCAALVVLAFPQVSARADEGNSDFEDFMTEQWKETMESDYLTMHYSVKDYEKYGLEKPEPSLGTVSKDNYTEAVAEDQKVLDELEEFDYESLSDSQKISYDVLKFLLEQAVIIDGYWQFDEQFNPYTGTLSNLITNFTEFTFYEKEDIDDYLTLISQVADYMEQMMDLTKEQASAGYFMPDSALDQALQDMQDFVDKGEENPLIVIFNENVEAFEGLTADEISAYEAENYDYVINQILPEYETCMTELESLRGSRNNETGLSGYSDAAEYVEAMIKYQACTDISASDMMTFLEEALTQCILYYQKASMTASSEGESTVSMSDPEEVLNYLKDNLDDFPEGPDVDFSVAYLDKSVENDAVVAYYMTCPIDDLNQNIIKVNQDNISDSNDLYTTLAHEGFPGHLYQFTYYYSTDPNLLRTVVSMMAYQEGWAQYASNLMVRKSGLSETAALETEVNDFYGYVYSTIVDIGVNALGWTLSDVLNYLNAGGSYYTESEAKDFMEYAMATPLMFIPYGYGQAYFMTLRARAIMSLGQAFDEVSFHSVLLDEGPRTFEQVTDDVDAWIESQGYTVNTSAKAYDEMIQGVPNVSPSHEPSSSSQVESSDSTQNGSVSENSSSDSSSGGSRNVFVIIACVVFLFLIVFLVVMLTRPKKNKNGSGPYGPNGGGGGYGPGPYGNYPYGNYPPNNYQQGNYQQGNYQQGNYQQGNYQQGNYQQPQNPYQNNGQYSGYRPGQNPYPNRNGYPNQYPNQNPYSNQNYYPNQNPYQNQNPYSNQNPYAYPPQGQNPYPQQGCNGNPYSQPQPQTSSSPYQQTSSSSQQPTSGTFMSDGTIQPAAQPDQSLEQSNTDTSGNTQTQSGSGTQSDSGSQTETTSSSQDQS